MNGGFTAAARPTRSLAIDRNAAIEGPDRFSDPAAKRHLELLRLQRSEDPQKRLRGGDAVLEPQKLAQPFLLLLRPTGDVLDGVTNRSARRPWESPESPQKSCNVPLLGLRGSPTSLKQHLRLAFVTLISLAQKKRVDLISEVPTSSRHKPMDVIAYSLHRCREKRHAMRVPRPWGAAAATQQLVAQGRRCWRRSPRGFTPPSGCAPHGRSPSTGHVWPTRGGRPPCS